MQTFQARCGIRILVANPDSICCQLLADALAGAEDFEVVGRVSEIDQLAASFEQSRPAVLLLSIHFKELVADRFAGLSRLLADHRDLACVLAVDSSEVRVGVDAFRAGVKGVFACAENNLGLLQECVRRVVEGQIWVEPAHMDYLVSSVPDVHWKEAAKKQVSNVLTPREEGVVQLLAEGLRNREIAARLGLSDNTVKNYIFRIFEKLGFSNRVEVVLYATTRQHEKELADQSSNALLSKRAAP